MRIYLTLMVTGCQRRIFIFGAPGYFALGALWKAEVAVVTFSYAYSAPVPKFLNPDPGPIFFKFENSTPVQTPAIIDVL